CPQLPPACAGDPSTRVYALFRAWQLSGTWAQIEAALQSRADGQGQLGWDISVDSTTSRAHIHAAGARRDSSDRLDGEPDNHALGRSRGGFSTKIHLACDQHLQAVSFTLTAGQAGDSPQLTEVLDRIRVARPGPGRPRSLPDRVLADKAYSSQANRSYLRGRKITTTIPVPQDPVGPAVCRIGCWRTWPPPHRRTGRTCGAGRSPPRSRSKRTRPTTVRPKGLPVGGHRPSTLRRIRAATSSNAASTRSNTTAG